MIERYGETLVNKSQRSIQGIDALMFARAKRPVSIKALLVLVMIVAMDLVGIGRHNIPHGRDRKESVKQQILKELQNSGKIKSPSGQEVSYHLTQILSVLSAEIEGRTCSSQLENY